MRFNWHTLYCPAMIASYLSILVVLTGWVPPRVVSTPFVLLGNVNRTCSLAHHRVVDSSGTCPSDVR